ncbi:Crp/Fnr family transcriptional regulator [Variovorax sp. ZT4R33]|uniref:Crp/Fnr family transcriptional regulator n=1 Tax=Variovorax sp. ZT4R33 TaxID=3443743 RepID=UPI003F453C66
MTNHVQTIEMLRAAAWAQGLSDEEFGRVRSETVDRFYSAGEIVCRKSSLATHWIGVVDGMLKVDILSADGRSTTLSGTSMGGWLGEGSVLKREQRPYEVAALRDSRVALVPSHTFHYLLENNLAFCHFMIKQLNARVGQFIALAESYRMHDLSSRVAHCLAELFNPQLNPHTDPILQISQEEIGRLAGISRQHAHRALHELEDAGLVCIAYGSIDVVNIDGLRAYAREHGE